MLKFQIKIIIKNIIIYNQDVHRAKIIGTVFSTFATAFGRAQPLELGKHLPIVARAEMQRFSACQQLKSLTFLGQDFPHSSFLNLKYG